MQFNLDKENNDGSDIMYKDGFLHQNQFDLSFQTHNTENGSVVLPWIRNIGISPTATISLPICFDGTTTLKDARVAHVVCRQAGSMVATKYKILYLDHNYLKYYCHSY